MWDDVFSWCVRLLENWAKKLDPWWPSGMNYVKINIILFCIILPIVLVLSLGLNLVWLISRWL